MTPEETLREMLTYRRPAGSRAERKFIRRFLHPLGVKQDAAGNLIKRIGDAPVMWSCHTDTVHGQGGRQTIIEMDGFITAPDSSCLGADDTAGVWLMHEMIRHGVPGLYVFHRAEEVGGYGSMHIADTNRALLEGIDFAIALDRKGENSVVTHQWGGRCCSQSFALALAAELDLGLLPDGGGTFTDTANYMTIIPECTNISVGYYDQHTKRERLCPDYLYRLRDALLELDVSKLPVVRVPTDNDEDWFTSAKIAESGQPANEEKLTVGNNFVDPFYGLNHYEALQEVIRYHPDSVADYLDGLGISADDILGYSGSGGSMTSHCRYAHAA